MPSPFPALLSSCLISAAGAANAIEINVLTAWYGQSCGAAHGNVTAHVKSRCDGKTQCDYVIDAGVLGDPANGCAKNFVALFTCSGKTTVMLSQVEAEANGRVLQMSCAPVRAPIATPLK